jgi:hypothetical protein
VKFNSHGHFILSTAYLCRPGYRSWHSGWLRAERFGDRIPVKARFLAPGQIGPWCPSSLLHVVYPVTFRGNATGTCR